MPSFPATYSGERELRFHDNSCMGQPYHTSMPIDACQPGSGPARARAAMEGLPQAYQMHASPSSVFRDDAPRSASDAVHALTTFSAGEDTGDWPNFPQSLSAAPANYHGFSSGSSSPVAGSVQLPRTSDSRGLGQSCYQPVSSLYASWQPLVDARSSSEDTKAAPAYLQNMSNTRSSLSIVSSARPADSIWVCSGESLLQSTHAGQQNSEGPEFSLQARGMYAGQSTRMDTFVSPSHRSRGGGQCSILYEDAPGHLQALPGSDSLRSASVGTSCSGVPARPAQYMQTPSLQTAQAQPTRRARLGTEASVDAQPNSEGAKAEESRQLSRVKALLSEHPADTAYTMTLLSAAAVRLSLPGLTKLISKLNKAGHWRQGLTVFNALPALGLVPDATVANAALGACDRGSDGTAAWSIFEIMAACALEADAISYKALVAALSKSANWRRCVLVFIRAVETGVPLEAMTVMAIISALTAAGRLQLAEGVFCCAFAAALDLQPLLSLPWPAEHGISSDAPGDAANGHTNGYTIGLSGNHSTSHLPGLSGFQEAQQTAWSPRSGQRQHAGQGRGQGAPALQAPVPAASGGGVLSLSSEEGIRAAVSAATALDVPHASPQHLLARLQALQAEARHASQTTRLNTYLKLYGEVPESTPPGTVMLDETSTGSNPTSNAIRGAANTGTESEGQSIGVQQQRRRSQPRRRRGTPSRATPSPTPTPAGQALVCASTSTSSEALAAQAVADSMTGSGTMRSDPPRAPPAHPGSPVSPVPPHSGSHSSSGGLVCNTRRSLGSIAVDPMARACCNAMLAGYANATPALGNRASTLLQILKESEALEPDVVAYNITLRALALSGQLQAAVDTLGQLSDSGHRARAMSFVPLLAATAASGSVRSVLELWVQLQRQNVSPDVTCVRAFALAALRSGSPELINEALSRFSAQMTVMSAAKASAEASALVLAHAECVPPELWQPPGMSPMELCHNLYLRQVPQKTGDSSSAGAGAAPAAGAQQWAPAPASGQSVSFGRMYAVPQVGPPPGPPPGSYNASLAYLPPSVAAPPPPPAQPPQQQQQLPQMAVRPYLTHQF